MKESKTSDFEKQLATFERTSLPPEWKDKLVDGAADFEKPIFHLYMKMSVGLIAAVWVAIAALHFSTPRSEIAHRTSIGPMEIALLAKHFEQHRQLNIDHDSL